MLRLLVCVTLCASTLSCVGTVPSTQLQRSVTLPMPSSMMTQPSEDRLDPTFRGKEYKLTPRSVIPIAFEFQPDIKSSFQRFKSEEARYDFFYTSLDSLTPRFRLSNDFDESRVAKTVTRSRDHDVEISLEKRFFDTTQLEFGLGYQTNELDDEIGNQPFVSVDLRYPLWASREKLERASEDIFRRNELDDAMLGYIQEARRRLQNVLFRFYDVIHLRRRTQNREKWQHDLEALNAVLQKVQGRDASADLRRLRGETARVVAEVRVDKGWYEIQLSRFKAACGIPFHVRVEMIEEPFNPFEGMSHKDLLEASRKTDPEIATLANAVRNSEVQLDLAKRGQWDIAFLLAGESNLEGRGERQGSSDWSSSFGLDVSAVDPRVTDSLIRQAQSNIYRFKQAIVARENAIYVDTFESLTRIDTLSASRQELIDNIPRYIDDYKTGISDYQDGKLNIDDLLKRRENLFQQREEISRLTFLVGANVAELCSATGKFFELIKPSEEEEK